MLSWQQNHLTRNLHKLLDNTICNEKLLARLQSEEILGRADLASIRCERNELTKVKILYEILQTRTNGYGMLAVSLAEEKQTGSFDILMEGYARNILSQFINQTEEYSNFDENKANEIVDTIKKYLAPNEFLQLHSQSSFLNEIKLLRNTVPPEIPNYIPRTLSKRVLINQAVFAIDCPDVFVFKNITQYTLTKLVEPQRTAPSSSQIDEGISCRFIRLDVDVDWEEIREAVKVPAHLINFDDLDKTCILEETVGYSTVIQQYLVRSFDSKKFHNFGDISEEQFLKQVGQREGCACYFICDSPGMGKTLLLANLLRQVSTRYSKRVVAFLKASDLMKRVNQRKPGNPADVVLELLSTSPMSKQILNELYHGGILHLELFVDGVDEVNPNEVRTAITFLDDMVKSMTNTRIYVTSRPHLRYEMEISLGVISYDILPFRHENKIDFLLNFWTAEKTRSERKLLCEFANFCLEKFEESCGNKEREITGIPLQCRLLAVVYARKAKRYCRSKGSIPLEETFKFENSLSQLYGEYLELGFEKCTTVVNNEIAVLLEIKHSHIYIALNTVVPQLAERFSTESGVNFTTTRDNNIFSAGLLQKCFGEDGSEDVEFVHRTFAEYLAADFFATALHTKSNHWPWEKAFKNEVIQFLFENILMTNGILPEVIWVDADEPDLFFYPVVAYFLNFGLKEFSTPDISLLSVDLFETERFCSLLWSCLCKNYATLFNLVTNTVLSKSNDTSENMKPLTLGKEHVNRLIVLGIKFARVPLMDQLFHFFSNFLGHDEMTSYLNLDWYAVELATANRYEMVQYFIEQNLVNNPFALITHCLKYSDENIMNEIEKKLDICRLLLSVSTDPITNLIIIKIMKNKVHLTLLKWLVSEGVNYRVANSKRKNVVHFAAGYMCKEDLHELCRFFAKDCKARDIFLETENWGCSLSHILLVRKDALPDTIEMILENYGELDGKDGAEKIKKLVLIAFATKQSAEVVNILMKYGGKKDHEDLSGDDFLGHLPFLDIDCSPLDYKDNSFLHLAAMHYEADEYHKIVSFLSSHERRDVLLLENKRSELSIHFAVEKFEVEECTVQVFQNIGVDFKNLTVSLLICAVRGKRTVPFLKRMVELGVDVYLKDEKGNTFVHLIPEHYSPEEYHEIVQYIIAMGYGEVLEMNGRRKRTPLHEAVKFSELLPETMDLLAANVNVSWNAVDVLGDSILHAALRGRRSLGLVKRLIEMGVDCTLKNHEGSNLAHKAATYNLVEHFKYFVELGCDINAVDSYGNNTLQCAVQQSKIAEEIVHFLVSKNVDKRNVNKAGKTALMIALAQGTANKQILEAISAT